jgi:hypothetical protein
MTPGSSCSVVIGEGLPLVNPVRRKGLPGHDRQPNRLLTLTGHNLAGLLRRSGVGILTLRLQRCGIGGSR